MRKENRLSLKRLFWDYDFSEKELEDLLRGNTLRVGHLEKTGLYARMLSSLPWYDILDVPYRSGGTESFDLFPRVDGWWNILSNTITALAWREPKDVADIVFLCRRYHFTWQNVFREFFSRVQWIDEVSLDDVFRDLQIVAKDILQRKANTLASAV